MTSERTRIVAALKKILRSRGMTYRAVAAGLGLSESSVKRLFAEESFSIDRLETICGMVEMSIGEVARIASEEQPTHGQLTMAQEKALASDPKLLTFFYLIKTGWSPDEIVAHYEIEPLQSVQLLAALDRLGLIELLPGNRVRLLTARSIDWRPGGPVRRAYETQARSEFLQSSFADQEATFAALTGELSAASIAVIGRKLTQLRATFEEMVEMDAHLAAAERKSMGLMLAMRPWVFSVFRERQRR